METLVNLSIAKVEEKFTKDYEFGKKTLYKLKFNENENWFSWFFPADKGLQIPVVGLNVSVLDYDVSKSDCGKYTNYTVKRLTFAKDQQTTQTPHRTPQNAAGSTFSQNKGGDIGPMTMWGKYIGEVISALIGKGLIGKDLDDAAKDAMETFADCCIVFERQYSNVIELPKPAEKINDPTVHEPEDPDEPPLPEPPPY